VKDTCEVCEIPVKSVKDTCEVCEIPVKSVKDTMCALRLVGFCGVDDSVSPALLVLLSARFPFLEWGVLFRTDLQGTVRYASPQWLQSLIHHKNKANVDMNLAAHLCRDRCQQVIEGDSSFVSSLPTMGFRRAQINATAANGVVVDSTKLSYYADNIRTIARSFPNIEWIFQYNDETKPIWEHIITDVPSNMSMLYDASCGKGVQIQSFPSPTIYPNVPCGYAGGIGPNTINSVLPGVIEVAKTSSFPVWIDMESSLRMILADGRDEFNINACMICIQSALEHGLDEVK
jgi:hypothetical protein